MVSHFEDSVDFSRIVLEDSCHNRFSVCFFFFCMFFCAVSFGLHFSSFVGNEQFASGISGWAH